MEPVYQCWEASLQAAGFTRAAEKPGHFFRRLTESTAFVLNCAEKSWGVEIIYGFASIPVNAAENGLLDYFDRVGFEAPDCILRFSRDFYAPEDAPGLHDAIAACFRQYGGLSKSELLEASKEKRKAFFNLISAKLRPLGFRKKGNKWTAPLGGSLLLEVWAQKSGWSDEYYLNVSVFPKDPASPGACFQTRITAGDTDCFDWQLIPPDFWDRLLQKGADTLLIPLLQADPQSLPSLLQKSSRWIHVGGR